MEGMVQDQGREGAAAGCYSGIEAADVFNRYPVAALEVGGVGAADEADAIGEW